jgi:hypothetical protein
MTRREMIYRITEYLEVGGLFNPEMMEHDKVRDLIMECREILQRSIVLTPDDILTLKLLRDYLREQLLGNWKTSERDHVLETLERILKQVG